MSTIQDLLMLEKPPIGIGFFDSAPEGLAAWRNDEQPAGCSFWAIAFSGESFFTTPDQHYNCAVGCHTHNIPLPDDKAPALEATIGKMVESQYLDSSEVATIPILEKTPGVIAYAPIDLTTFKPDIVLIAVTPAQSMLIYEAALKTEAGHALTQALGRPACAVIPVTEQSQSVSVSFGCKGNRTFTKLDDSQFYISVPGLHWQALSEKIEETVNANNAMESFYQYHEKQFST